MPLRLIWVAFYFLMGLPLMAQKVSIVLGPSPVPIDQYFTLSVRVEGGEIKLLDPFPEIEGFRKSTRFATTTTTTVSGLATVTKSVTQRYAALEEGTFELKPFTMRVNNVTVSSRGGPIIVVPMGAGSAEQQAEREEVESSPKEDPEYLDLKEDAFLSVSTTKKEAYVGEGVMSTLWFYVAVADQHLLQFHDFANQLPVIVRQLRQKNAWAEAIDLIGEVVPEKVMVGGKEYLRYRLHAAVYYPLNAEPLVFPSVRLNMAKYKMAQNPSFAGESRQEEIKTYISSVKTVAVRELPPHPLRLTAPVGHYHLREELNRPSVEAGKSLTYSFTLEGEGNLAAVLAPSPSAEDALEMHPPAVTQQIDRLRTGIKGAKTFQYHLLARQPGKIDLGDYFRFVYFNPTIGRYDTLRSQLTMQVTGEGDANADLQARDMGLFYNLIQTEDNTLVSLHRFEEIKRSINYLLLVLVVLTLIMFFKK
ncbi:BatD family protein [soil metagenome]